MSERILLIDIGSTFTKATAVDLEGQEVLATARALTTVKEDVTIGLRAALAAIEQQIGSVQGEAITACSSAAGGLRIVSIGLIPELSLEAAKRAALGAGAKVVGHYHHELTRREAREIEAASPDLILLAGGTDGGNETAIIHNAKVLAAMKTGAPIIVAGNKCAYDEIEDTFEGSGKTTRFVGNVMPEIGQLEVQACREAIRSVFMENIVKAKGLDRVAELASTIIMPTPAAVLNAAALLANGLPEENGLGELIVVDVGGATTDVYSIAKGTPTRGGVLLKGLPEPFAKRTVEGDLGVRHNIDTLCEICSEKAILLDERAISAFKADAGRLPADDRERAVDARLARTAVETSFERHVGKLEVLYGPQGDTLVQVGKDLSAVGTVVGTGGPIIHSSAPREVLAGVLAGPDEQMALKPQSAEFCLDADYIMYAVGLLARSEPLAALRIAKRHLRKL